MKYKKKKYDVAIIGGGISGIMAALRLNEKQPGASIILIEKGASLDKRKCPMIINKTGVCSDCNSCAIMEGVAGAGAFSDGKYVISTEYGGWLPDFLSHKMVIDYIEQADAILVENGATTERYDPDNELKKLCLKHDLHMQQAQLKHLGTDSNFDTMCKLVDKIDNKIEIITRTEVVDVDKDTHTLSMDDGEQITADAIIFAIGRAGSRSFADWCRKNDIGLSNNQVDIGVRVELPSSIWEHFSKKIYEPKIWYRSNQYGDTTRMFCFNERGNVVMENTDGVMTVNGHSYRGEERKTQNSNFALLSTIRFTQPFKNPIEYARYVASLANLISGGSILVQRLGDLELGRRTNEKRLKQSTTRPTLDVVPGDLSLCMPKRQLDNILETIHALDIIAQGTANHDTLLYGVECKYYSSRPDANDFELAGTKGIYAIGDGAGFTRSLSHAAAHGLYIADKIVNS
ncbi:MAG: FAD-dependent oxidoreductase [Clostridiales bacterium]|nr:FAD-dependent oxidoreductase [Clostridiales bacterium]